jgi:prepilin-type N-terminal cleavage/methylation domain-containing protein
MDGRHASNARFFDASPFMLRYVYTIRMKSPTSFFKAAFTLIELIVVIAIVCVLAGLLLPVLSSVQSKGYQTATLSNMKQMGAALMSYAGDNNMQLPNRASATGGAAQPNKWPVLLQPYVQNINVYVSPIPDVVVNGKTLSYHINATPAQLLSNTTNYTSYIYNGFNDLNAYNNPAIVVQLNNIGNPAQVILLGVPYPQQNNYYMDFVENNEGLVLNRAAFRNASPYVFSDGSARMLTYTSTDVMTAAPTNGGKYTDWLWLVNKGYSIP